MVYDQQTHSIQVSANQSALAHHKASSIDIPPEQMLALAFAGKDKTPTMPIQLPLHYKLARWHAVDPVFIAPHSTQEGR